jgi:hypothetical protein
MFALLAGMKWAHLPEAGGMYDQDPQFVSDMFYILQQVGIAQNEKLEAQKDQAEKNKRGANKGLLGHPSRVKM